jgi:hypothetical protein
MGSGEWNMWTLTTVLFCPHLHCNDHTVGHVVGLGLGPLLGACQKQRGLMGNNSVWGLQPQSSTWRCVLA